MPRDNSGKLFFGFLVSFIGSAISTVALFVGVTQTFGSHWDLAIALAVKTLSMIAAGMLATGVSRALGLSGFLVLSQVIGAGAVILAYAGLATSSRILTMVGVSCSGFASTAAGVGLTAGFRLGTNSERAFRRISSLRGTSADGVMLVAALATPLFMHHVGLKAIVMFDVVTYCLGAVIFYAASRGLGPFHQQVAAKVGDIAGKRVGRVALGIMVLAVAAFLPIGYPPLVTLGGELPLLKYFSGSIPSEWRASAWGLELGAGMLVGLVYGNMGGKPGGRGDKGAAGKMSLFHLFFALSGIWIGLAVYAGGAVMQALALFATSVCFSYGKYCYRDDFVLLFTKGEDVVRASARFSLVVSGSMALSPLLLVLATEKLGGAGMVHVVAAAEVVMAIAALWLLRSTGTNQRAPGRV